MTVRPNLKHVEKHMSKATDSVSHVKYPDIQVRLVGEDGNAFAILGRVTKAMRRAGVPKSETDLFFKEAMSGDYNRLLATCMAWVDCH
jgi:hypothetical protein